MKSLKYIIAAISICICTAAVAQNQTALSKADISIRYYNKTIFYPKSPIENPIFVRISIANKTPETLRFKLADDRIFSMDFTAVTNRNIPVSHTETFMRKRSRNEPVFFREIALEPGEEYSFTENVKDYLLFEKPGMYVLQSFFYPELNRLEPPAGERISDKNQPPIQPMMTNRLTLEIRPAPNAAVVRSLALSPETHDILKRSALPPDQIVEQTLIARQKNNWDEFFLYMDLEEMINRNKSLHQKFISESADGRNRIIENYKNDLRTAVTDRDIIMVPDEFRIERTSYTPTEGTVSSIQWFFSKNVKEQKRYTYNLHQKDGIWLIYDYTVDNISKE